jgi:hypothetical protein
MSGIESSIAVKPAEAIAVSFLGRVWESLQPMEQEAYANGTLVFERDDMVVELFRSALSLAKKASSLESGIVSGMERLLIYKRATVAVSSLAVREGSFIHRDVKLHDVVLVSSSEGCVEVCFLT